MTGLQNINCRQVNSFYVTKILDISTRLLGCVFSLKNFKISWSVTTKPPHAVFDPKVEQILSYFSQNTSKKHEHAVGNLPLV